MQILFTRSSGLVCHNIIDKFKFDENVYFLSRCVIEILNMASTVIHRGFFGGKYYIND